MKPSGFRRWMAIAVLVMGTVISSMACGIGGTVSPTPTPTLVGGISIPPTPSPNRCEGLSGEFEMQVLVGPSEVVGLEPLAVGTIPFSVVSDGGTHIIQGSGSISYQDVLEEEWGTYTVSFELEAAAGGECEGDESSGMLHATITVVGEQLVEVRAEGFQGDYPWSGSYEFDLSFPISEGASAMGEGWQFILHLGN